MAKILIKKVKKEIVNNKRVFVEKPRTYYVKDATNDYHSADGIISKKDLKKKDGSIVKSTLGKEFSIFTSTFADDLKKIERAPQIIPRKDVGLIVIETGVNKNSKVVDAGSGSGALACSLANICKEVTSYELREDFFKVANNNKKFLDLKNLKIKNKDVYKGIDEKNVDLITLDLPSPWNAIRSVEKALKIGGYLVSYSPTVPQVMDFVSVLENNDNFLYLETCEIIKRNWDVSERKVRPKSEGIGHSGFLTFVRKIK